MPEPTVYLWRENAAHQRWRPTTLHAEGKDEKFLEQFITEKPDLLGLESRGTGIYGPFVPFRQLGFVTPQGRNIRPDVVFLTASGHAVIVEVKRYGNPELRERHVIAQVVDYAASFAALKPEELLGLFKPSLDASDSWPLLVERLFPKEDDPRELADVLLRRFRDGEVHLVIACDREPTGLREMVEGVASQSALSFGFSVVELRPYVSDEKGDGILFFQNVAVETEIVTRTAVTFSIRHGDTEPKVEILVDSPKKVEQAVEKARRQGGGRQHRTIVDESRPLLIAAVEDLIRAGRVGVPKRGSWGYSIKNSLVMEQTGRFNLIVRFMDYGDDHVPPDAKGTITIDFNVAGKRERERRLADVERVVDTETGPLAQTLRVDIKRGATKHGPNWILPADVIPLPQTPEAIAAWMEKVYRHLTAHLPLRAARAFSEADLVAAQRGGEGLEDDEGVGDGDHDEPEGEQ